MANFLLIGACGYIAPRHLQAIKDVNGNLLAALDPHDSAGHMDKYFPDVAFFTEFERFERYTEKLLHDGIKIDYVTVCSPNYLHDAHCRFGMRIGADVICEKPLAINTWNIEMLQEMEESTGRRVNVIQQLRLHPAIVALRDRVLAGPVAHRYRVELSYVTPRGPWYQVSWKGDEEKSGGMLMNLGVHFFDMLLWIFGPAEKMSGVIKCLDTLGAICTLRLERANVTWALSTRQGLPIPNPALRQLVVDGEVVDFSQGFTELHTESYRQIMAGNGFGCADALPAIGLIHELKGRTKGRT